MKQKGLTLIELMIVIAIIGILASIAIPTYQDYVIRARVTEGLSFASSAETVVSENASSGAADLGQGWVTPSATTNVEHVAITAGTGVITITYTPSAKGITLTLSPQAGGTPLVAGTPPTDAITWKCAVKNPEKNNRYVPASCRS